ncbi:NAD-P-binding protein [Mycena alexandri]|uniref:NAD-P-binding protein n=1 Tax=Mycena alexandri TaxID=1745969 RepID=A0AAD6X4U3_9AGAR|nr:NAD-P-binding protein [Mycena alexandri]
MASLIARLLPPGFRPERDIPDLSGKFSRLSWTVLATGGNTGIGYQTIKQLLLKNATVYLAARSPQKAADAIKRLEGETKKTAIFLQLDLADLPSVRRAAESYLAVESGLDILFNNGGVMVSPPAMMTAQNHDLQFDTNVIGHFFLTELLLPALSKSYQETSFPARVINTSSIGHQLAPGSGMELVSLKAGPERDAWLKKTGDFMSRWRHCNVLVSNYFARTHAKVLVSCAVHPGGIKTKLGRHTRGFMQALGNAYLYPASMGAFTQRWGATVATPEQINGRYLIPWGKVGKADKRASNKALEDEVIAYIQKQIKGF